MSDFFNVDNKFFTAMTKLADIIIVNLFFLFTVILGIGPACTALYYACMKNIRKSRNYLTKCYFHSFKQNFRQGFIIGLIQIAFGAMLSYCVAFAWSTDEKNTIGQVYFWGIMVFVFFYIMTFVYVYPILSRYNLSVGKALKTAFLLGIKHFITSIILVAGFVATVLGVIVLTYYIYTPFVLIGPAIYCLLSTFFIERCFRKSIPEPEQEEGAEPIDAWWRED